MSEKDDFKRFCLNCNWNDCDYGCTVPVGEDVYQCPMYIHYHPEEVKKFNEAMEKWAKENVKNGY